MCKDTTEEGEGTKAGINTVREEDVLFAVAPIWAELQQSVETVGVCAHRCRLHFQEEASAQVQGHCLRRRVPAGAGSEQAAPFSVGTCSFALPPLHSSSAFCSRHTATLPSGDPLMKPGTRILGTGLGNKSVVGRGHWRSTSRVPR